MRDLDGPADTRIMGVAHNALKRDLRRARDVLAASPTPRGRQRRALGEHVLWMLDFLHEHHSGEDTFLWPLMRDRNPAAADLLDSMEADHARIAPAAEAAAEAARAYVTTTTDPPRAALVDALDELMEVLFPHLDREVAEAMPVASACLTARDWDDFLKHLETRPTSPRAVALLAMQALWALEGTDAESYAVATAAVPAPLLFVLVHGFGRSYRRHAAERWGPDRSAGSAAA